MKNNQNNQKKKDTYFQEKGFFLPSAQLYGGVKNSWDFSLFGCELKKKIKNLFWKYFVEQTPYNFSWDSSIITHPEVLSASGHQKHFFDWVICCQRCQKQQRVEDSVSLEEWKKFKKEEKESTVSAFSFSTFVCSLCGSLNYSSFRRFSGLLTTKFNGCDYFLRPETCQAIFLSFFSLKRIIHRQLPFGVGQIGKSFRQETTFRHGIFRLREFEQMELEFFCEKEKKNDWWNYWEKKTKKFLQKMLINTFSKNYREEELSFEELPHYSEKTKDLFFLFSFGWGEIGSISDRDSYDLIQHFKKKPRLLSLIKKTTVVEVSLGVERLMLAILEDAFSNSVDRDLLSFSPLLSPYFLAVLFVHQNCKEKAWSVFLDLLAEGFPFNITFENSSSIGKSYYHQDAVGTYFCLTVDQKTVSENRITLRFRDSREQKTFFLDDLKIFLRENYDQHWKSFFL